MIFSVMPKPYFQVMPNFTTSTFILLLSHFLALPFHRYNIINYFLINYKFIINILLNSFFLHFYATIFLGINDYIIKKRKFNKNRKFYKGKSNP